MASLSIVASGMVTSVGLHAESSCAAIRCGIDHFRETRFKDKKKEWITGAEVPMEQAAPGIGKLVQLIVPAIRECLDAVNSANPENIPLLLFVAEKDRPGRVYSLDEELLRAVQTEVNIRFHQSSAIIANGRIGGAAALQQAMTFFDARNCAPYCIIAGVDSYLTAGALSVYENRQRILTAKKFN